MLSDTIPYLGLVTWNMCATQPMQCGNLEGMMSDTHRDIGVFQEASSSQKLIDTLTRMRTNGWNGELINSELLGGGGKGYAILWNTHTIQQITAAQFIDIGLGAGLRPPLYTQLLETVNNRTIHLFTWHAPADAMKSNGSYVAAQNALIAFRANPTVQATLADAGSLWVFAGDLNVKSDFINNQFPAANGFLHKANDLDHVIVKQALDMKKKGHGNYNHNCGSDVHQPLFVEIDY